MSKRAGKCGAYGRRQGFWMVCGGHGRVGRPGKSWIHLVSIWFLYGIYRFHTTCEVSAASRSLRRLETQLIDLLDSCWARF